MSDTKSKGTWAVNREGWHVIMGSQRVRDDLATEQPPPTAILTSQKNK